MRIDTEWRAARLDAAGIEEGVSKAPEGTWVDYLGPLRLDHWIKNAVVPIGSTLALVAARTGPEVGTLVTIVAAFVVSGFVSSVNYAINEVLDAPYDARHPVKRRRPIPSGRVRVGPLLALTALIAVLAFGAAAWLFPARFVVANLCLFVAALLYNLPPARLKDWPYLDVVVESVTNPIRIAIGWYAVSPTGLAHPPAALLLGVWAFGGFLMTGKRLAELRMLGARAARYRETFSAYTIARLFVAQLGYAALTLAGVAWLFLAHQPRLLVSLPLIVVILAWTFKMTFDPDSPLVDPERLYRRPRFLLLMLAAFVAMIAWGLA